MSAKSDLIDHLRALPDDDALVAEVSALVNGVVLPYMPGACKPSLRVPLKAKTIDGKLNPEWIVELRDIWVDFNQQWWNYYGHQWPMLADQVKGLYKEAEQWGIDLKTFAPETLGLLEIAQIDKTFEYTAEQLDSLASRIEKSHEIGLRSLDPLKKKSWAFLLRRTGELQRLCREEAPLRMPLKSRPKVRETWKYLHALRYALYTMRSKLGSTDGSESFLMIPKHLIEMLMSVSIARHHCVSHSIIGALCQVAPGHGKSLAGVADRALELCKRPWRGCAIVHNTEEIAIHRVKAVIEHFDDSMPVGRRRRALFPHVRRHRSSKATVLFLEVGGKRPCPHQEGNLFAAGVHGRRQGVSVEELHLDDPSDEKEALETGTRERTNASLMNTWLPRLRGRNAFFVDYCTSWHPQDFAGLLREQFNKGVIRIAYYGRHCGGPEDNFRPLWPEGGYDAKFLRRQYETKGPAAYASIYQNNSDSESVRSVKRLHFYDGRLHRDWINGNLVDQAWKRFFEGAKWFLVIDPSGTARARSDYAGMMYSAYGMLEREADVAGVRMSVEEPKLVFCNYWSDRMSQHDLVEKWVLPHCHDHKVDQIIVETVGGFHATVELLVRTHGFDARRVQGRPANLAGNKAQKLLKYSIHLDNGDALFPGELGTNEAGRKELMLSTTWGPVADQLYRAGSIKEDNLLDCVRLTLTEVAADIAMSRGEWTGPGNPFAESPEHARLREFYERTLKAGAKKPKDHRPKNHLLTTRRLMAWS